MNDSNENLKENSNKEAQDPFDNESPVLPDEKSKSNDVNEVIDENNNITEVLEIKESEEENIDLTNETKEEKLESDESKKEELEEQLRTFHKNLIEAALYAAGKPLTVEEISNKLELPKKDVEELINEVAFEYLDRSTALVIALIGDSYQMQIKPEYTEKVSKFAKGGAIAEKYLRTLTIIALKQPILKSTVIKLRGTGAYEHIKYLIDNAFIDAVKKGRSQELTTTDKYADMFGLPKDKTELKRIMISQLGITEDGIQVQSSEDDDQIELSEDDDQMELSEDEDQMELSEDEE